MNTLPVEYQQETSCTSKRHWVTVLPGKGKTASLMNNSSLFPPGIWMDVCGGDWLAYCFEVAPEWISIDSNGGNLKLLNSNLIDQFANYQAMICWQPTSHRACQWQTRGHNDVTSTRPFRNVGDNRRKNWTIKSSNKSSRMQKHNAFCVRICEKKSSLDIGQYVSYIPIVVFIIH